LFFSFQGAKDGDYHQEMNGPIFLIWFENQLMPALKSPSVIVLDNASYHNIKTEETVVPKKGSLGHQNHQLVTTCSQWHDSD
jgi:transposase